LRDARNLPYADARMKDLLLALLHLAVMAAKLCPPGGVRAVMAENLLLKRKRPVNTVPPFASTGPAFDCGERLV
jgi:hypothetical protein